MSKHWVFNGCDEAVKKRLEEYWTKKLPRLQKHLVHYNVDLQDIRLTVYCHQQNPQRFWYEVRSVIHLPTGTVVAEANDKAPHAAIDSVVDTLVEELKRHKEHVRQDYVFKRKTRDRTNLSAAGPLLQADREKGRREDFFKLLRPLLGYLRDHARRELHMLERDGMLHRGEATVADVLDEVVARAWEHFEERPKKLALDLWLVDSLHDVLEEWVEQEPRAHASLHEEVKEDKPPEEPGGQEWWNTLIGNDEHFTLSDLIPDAHEPPPWEELSAQEQRERLMSLLGQLPGRQRQAFLLHALENYSLAEIAMLQDRPESEVRADIEAARQTLKEQLLADEDQEANASPAVAGAAEKA